MVDDCSPNPSRGEVQTPQGYRLVAGSTLDRALLLKTMRRTYQELHPQRTFEHLAQTIDAYLSPQTPLWWLEALPEAGLPKTSQDGARDERTGPPETVLTANRAVGLAAAHQRPGRRIHPAYVGGLWMGTATDQVSGLRHAHIFLLYVQPEHRRKGLGRCLMQQAEAWAKERGDRQISLQVFEHNAVALSLYQSLGYQPQSIALVKPLQSPVPPLDASETHLP